MSSNQKFIDLSKELIASVDARDGLLMQQKMDALELVASQFVCLGPGLQFKERSKLRLFR